MIVNFKDIKLTGLTKIQINLLKVQFLTKKMTDCSIKIMKLSRWLNVYSSKD